MAKKEVTVVINGEEYVSKAAKEAEQGLTGFAGFMQQFKDKLIPVIDVTKLVEIAVRALTSAFQAGKQFVMDSIGAYDAYVSAQVKLNAQSKLTGMSMREMGALVDDAKTKFGLGTVAAVDIAAAVAKFASQAGKSADAGKLMAAALELGAASGQTATQVAEGLSSALAGNDEWLNRLGLANPSGLWKDYADANGLAVSKMSDTEKKLAVMTALMDAGGKVTGVYGERLQSAAGQQDRLNNNLDTAKVLFGAALQPVRLLVIQGLTALLNVIGPVVIALGYLASGITNAVIAPFALARSAVGSLMEAFGKLTGNKELEAWGAKQSQVFVKFTDDVAKWLGLSKPANEAVNQQAKAHQLAAVQITASANATDAHTRATKAAEAAHKPLYAALGMTQGAMERLAQVAKDQLPPKPAQDFNAALDKIRQNADALILKFPPITAATEDAATNSGEMAREVERVARGAIDAASSFGVIDDSAARSLNSAVNIASAVKDMAANGFTFGGAVGIIGGVASLVGTMMASDAERRRLLRDNNTALARLSRDIGGLKLNVTGEDISKARTALGGTTFDPAFSQFVPNFQRLTDLLSTQGLTFGDFERIAKELGIDIKDKSGSIQFAAVNQAIQAISRVQPGRLGSDFGGQLDFFREGQRIEGTTGTNAIQGLLDFLRNVGGVSALDGLNANDPQALRGALRNLFTRLNNGEGVQGLGKLTGQQFMDLILQIIGDIDGLGGSGASTGGDVTVPTGGGSGGSTSAPAETIQSVIKAMDTNLAGILTSHTTIHERIAAATEGSYTELRQINSKMDELIVVTAGQIEATDAKLEAMRRMAALERGERQVFG